MKLTQVGIIKFGGGLNEIQAVWDAIERGYEIRFFPKSHAELYKWRD